MANSFKDNFFQSPNLRSKHRATPVLPPGLLDRLPGLFPSPDPTNPFGDPPKIPSSPGPNSPTLPAPARPILTFPSPPRPGPSPFPEPQVPPVPRLPPMLPQQPPPYKLPPFDYPGQGENEPGGLLGLLLAVMRQGQVQPGAESVSAPDDAQMYAAPPQDGERNPQAVNAVGAAAPDVRSRSLSRTVSSAFANRDPEQMTPPQRGALLGLVSGQPMPQWQFPPPTFGPRR